MSFLSSVSAVANGASQIIRTYNNIRGSFDAISGAFDGGNVGTFSESGYTLEEYKRELFKAKINLDKLQHADVFKVEITRVEPYYDKEKSELITSMMKSISVVHDGLETQEDRVGSGYFNSHKGRQSGEIQGVFHEFKDGSVVDFLTKISSLNSLHGAIGGLGIGAAIGGVSQGIEAISGIASGLGATIPSGVSSVLNGLGAIGGLFNSGGALGNNKNQNIIPSNGTTLLPYQYYFRIKISNLVSDFSANRVYEMVVLEDDFILEGNLSTEYSTGEEQYLEVTATFKPIKSWR